MSLGWTVNTDPCRRWQMTGHCLGEVVELSSSVLQLSLYHIHHQIIEL